VFSRPRGDRKVIALVTDDVKAPTRNVVADYLKRWAVELLIKSERKSSNWGWAITTSCGSGAKPIGRSRICFPRRVVSSGSIEFHPTRGFRQE